MNSSKLQVAIILINYNSSGYTIDCVASIIKHTSDIRYQIIVVDNNSREEEFNKLAVLRDPRVTVHRSRLNVGFSGANMIGVQLAAAEYYYFLNNDTELINDCIGILYRYMEANPKVANASAEMYDGAGNFDCGFGYFPTIALKLFGSGILRLFSARQFPPRTAPLKEPTIVDFVSGSSMFIRAEPFEKIGGLDTHYFLYCEEEDIALSLRRNGFLTAVVPEAKYKHYMNKSTDSTNKIRLPFRKEYYISLLYYYRKHNNSFYVLLIQLMMFVKAARKFYKTWDYARLAWFILKGAPSKESLRFRQTIR